MYKVIGSLKTRAFRVAWMLNELGQPFTVDPVPPRDASISSLNPSGKVPPCFGRGGGSCALRSTAFSIVGVKAPL